MNYGRIMEGLWKNSGRVLYYYNIGKPITCQHVSNSKGRITTHPYLIDYLIPYLIPVKPIGCGT
jgi:hypothetical protein